MDSIARTMPEDVLVHFAGVLGHVAVLDPVLAVRKISASYRSLASCSVFCFGPVVPLLRRRTHCGFRAAAGGV